MARRDSLIVEDLTFQYGREAALAGISFTAVPGDWIALFGGAGAGKTTLLRLLAGQLRPEAGSVQYPSAGDRPGISVEFARASAAQSGSLSVSKLLARSAGGSAAPAARRSAQVAEIVDL